MPTYATLGTLSLRLAHWREVGARYRDEYTPVDPSLKFLPNEPTRLVAEQGVSYWAVRDWGAGEGEDRWNPDNPGIEESTNVTRRRSGRGLLVLGANQTVTKDSGGVNAFNDGRRFGYGLGQLWTADDDSAYSWDVVNSRWSAAVATGGTTNGVTSLTDGDDTWMYSGHENLTIRRWKSGSDASWYATATGDDFTYNPVLRSFGGVLYALDGDDLYKIDKDTADTRTLMADTTGSSSTYLAETPWCYNRISLSDIGPIWFQRLDNGATLIWQYNVGQDLSRIVGKLPSDFAMPYSIFYSHGFIFVAYREAPTHTAEGPAYIYFQRGAQRGVLPQVRSTTGVTASKPILIAGVDGDDMIFYFDGATWVYNFTDGGMFQLATQTTTATPQDAITMRAGAFITPVTSGADTKTVERFDRLSYTTQTPATVDSGLYDFAYFDVPKIFTTLTVLTEPLPANTSVSAAYQIDGGSWTALAGTHDTDGATSYNWTVSSSATTVRGRNFGVQLSLASTDSTATPTVRGWTARTVTAADSRRILMEVDISTDGTQDTSDILASLRSLKASQAVVSLTLPFETYEHQAAQSFDVVVREVVLPDALSPTARTSALVVVHAVDLVVAS